MDLLGSRGNCMEKGRKFNKILWWRFVEPSVYPRLSRPSLSNQIKNRRQAELNFYGSPSREEWKKPLFPWEKPSVLFFLFSWSDITDAIAEATLTTRGAAIVVFKHLVVPHREWSCLFWWNPWDLIWEKLCTVVNAERQIIFVSRLNCAMNFTYDT